jgi:fibronectin type 3 domain-containing protein
VPGTTYFYVVAAVNAIGEGPRSNERSASASAVSTPTAPQQVIATPAKGKGITISWQAPASNGGSAITGYRIYRGTSPGGEATTPIQTVSGTSFKDGATTRGTTYYYVVRAVNSAGEGPASNESSATAR